MSDDEMPDEHLAWRKRLTLGLLLAIALVFLAQKTLTPTPNFVAKDTVCANGALPIQYGEDHPYPGDAFPSYVCP